MRRTSRPLLFPEQLESRDCPAIVFQNDYSQDVLGFFTPARRALVDFAEQQLLPSLQDNFAAITPDAAAGNTVSYSFENTANKQNVTIANPTIAANVIRVYLWGAPLANMPNASVLATAGEAAVDVQGSPAWQDTVTARGQAGRLATPVTDTSVSVIRVDVNMGFMYYENTAPPPTVPPTQDGGDLVTILEHELLHPLGFQGAQNPATQRLINAAGQFTGPAVVALAGGPVSMSVPSSTGGAPDVGSHWAPGTQINGVPAVETPSVTSRRLTPLDTAFLKDIGWETAQWPPPPAMIAFSATPQPASPERGFREAGNQFSGRFTSGQDTGGGTAQMNNPDGTAVFTVTPFPGFTGGVRTATGDFNGDGIPDLVVGTGPGRATQVRVLDGRTQAELFSVAPFEAAFTGGVYVAAGDMNGDGRADLLVTPDEGGGPRVQVYSGNGFGKLADFFGIDDANFRGGARPAVGDINGDGRPDLIVAAGFGGGPRVTVWANADVLAGKVPNATALVNRFVFEDTLRNGAFTAAGDVNADGTDDLISGGGPGGGPRVFILDGKTLAGGGADLVLGNFFGGDVNSRGGIRVAAKDLNADGRADVIVGAGVNSGPRVTAYDATSITPNGTPPTLVGFDVAPGFTGGVFVG